MNRFSDSVINAKVPSGKVGVFWAGQAGYVIKTHSGKLIGLDLYLSDCCNRYCGFKRIMPYLFDVNDFEFDLLLASHAHYDHFDVDSVPALMQNGKTELICANDVKVECERLSLSDNVTYVKCDDVIVRDEITVKAVPCDHGADTPDAVGFLINIDSKTIYFAGDTSYREDYLQNIEIQNTDLLILPINGAFGNLNEEQASLVASVLNPNLTVPCHFWNFGEHGGNPAVFADCMRKNASGVAFNVVRVGEGIII